MSATIPRGIGRAIVSALALVSCLVGAPRDAAAHGGIWRADQILVDPGDPGHVVLASDSWGAIETLDGGASWQWVCAEVYDGVSITPVRRSIALLERGALFMANGFDGLWRSSGSLCSFNHVAFFDDPTLCGGDPCVVSDVERIPSSATGLVVLTNRASYNALYTSNDSGTTWTALPNTIPTTLAAVSVGFAPTDASNLYVAALPSDVSTRVLLHSEDGGNTYATSSTTVDQTIGLPNDVPPLRVDGVSPADPNVVFLWLDYTDDTNATTLGPDRIVASFDGGASLVEVFRGTGNLPGFAMSPDGAAVFVSGPQDGLWSAKVAALRDDPAGAFQRVSAAPTWGLAWTSAGLLAGRDEYALPPSLRFSLGLSKDLGVSFEPSMIICSVTMKACPPGTTGAGQCPGQFYGELNFQYDFQSPRCATPDGGVDAGAKGRPAASPSSPLGKQGGCDVSGCDRDGSWPMIAAVIAVMVTTLRKRR
ncbi:MAG TPA: hypothetical protein VH142_01630 [Polyangiaceae bacterium]|jgi:hypothetical protein|nr:hypothetical protein [Polyangiaceae bacterium]